MTPNLTITSARDLNTINRYISQVCIYVCVLVCVCMIQNSICNKLLENVYICIYVYTDIPENTCTNVIRALAQVLWDTHTHTRIHIYIYNTYTHIPINIIISLLLPNSHII